MFPSHDPNGENILNDACIGYFECSKKKNGIWGKCGNIIHSTGECSCYGGNLNQKHTTWADMFECVIGRDEKLDKHRRKLGGRIRTRKIPLYSNDVSQDDGILSDIQSDVDEQMGRSDEKTSNSQSL